MRSQVMKLLVVVMSGVALATVPAGAQEAPSADAVDDVVVVAVLDGSFSPYHWDFLGSQMPQHLDDDPANDLPLRQSPDTWLPGFPSADTFASFNALDLTLPEDNPGANAAALAKQDAAEWDSVQQSTREATHFNWIPGTKIIGAVDYSGNKIRAASSPNASHGGGTSAVSVGNLHGTCPECLVVLVTYGGSDREAANDWALSQPWIDVVTHSYGYSTVLWDKIYSGSNLEAQRTAVERGQAVFWSASNGQVNAFDAPTTTYFSSSKGPDWLITVGATSPKGGNFTGSGKTVDLASIGSGYPSMGGSTVTGNGTFSGTSNATPVTAGLYSRALWRAREALAGPSRIQSDGAIASGLAVPCGTARADCELGDGVLTRTEMETRLFHGAQRTPEGPEVSITGVRSPVTTDEYDLASEGYGTYFGRVHGPERWAQEEAGIYDPMVGAAAPLERSAAERDWMVVDSFCRQSIWGSWEGGAYVPGQTQLPGADPAWPVRSALEAGCPYVRQPAQ